MEEKVFTPTCLLCNSYFDRKPAINFNSDGVDDDGGNQLGDGVGNDARKFKSAFNIFLRLLKGSKRSDEWEPYHESLVLGREFGQDGVGEENRETLEEECTGSLRNGQPCCGSCYVELTELCKLEEIIRETQTQQKNMVDNLRRAVSNNRHQKSYLDNGWEKVRMKLLDCLTVGHEMNERSHIVQEGALTSESIYNSDNDLDFGEPDPDPSSSNFPSSDNESKRELRSSQRSDFRKRSSDRVKSILSQGPPTKKRKCGYVKDSATPLVSSSPLSSATTNVKPCFVSLRRVNIEDFPNLRINGASSLKCQLRSPSHTTNSERNDVKIKMQKSISKVLKDTFIKANVKGFPLLRRTRASRARARALSLESQLKSPSQTTNCEETDVKQSIPNVYVFKDNFMVRKKSLSSKRNGLKRIFYNINEEILLFVCTPIKYSPMGFRCLEPNCAHFVEGSDYFTFENMKNHVIQCHENNYKGGISCSCPVCKKSFACGRSIRGHLLACHTANGRDHGQKAIVICESCWKPIPYHRYTMHTWLHKNEEERAAVVVASGSQLNSRLKRTLGFYSTKNRKWKSSIQINQSAKGTSCDSADSSFANLYQNQIEKSLRENRSLENMSNNCEGKSRKSEIMPGESKTPRKLHEFKRVFYPISKEILLFLCTPIRFSPAGFTCLEPSCTHFVEGSDYFTFENMKEHVINFHEKEYEFSTSSRTCPVCEETFSNAVSFRRHILVQHTSARTTKIIKTTVVCQSCWKHLPYSNFPLHTWSHKSDEDKAEMIASGEALHTTIKQKLINKLSIPGSKSDFLSSWREKQEAQSQNCGDDTQCMNELTSAWSTGPTSNQHQETATKTIKFKYDDLFFLLGENFIFFRDVILQYSPSELICMEKGCGRRIPGTEFNSFELFRKHVGVKRRKMEFILEGRQTCPICRIEFIGILPFRDHIFNDHSPPALCTSCWKPVENPDDIKRHSQLHMNQLEIQASYFPKASRKRQGVYYCADRMTSKMFTCKTCTKQFTTAKYLKNHEVIHLPKDQRPHFNCPDCGLRVLSKLALRSHIERTHRPESMTEKRKCHICPREFYHLDGDAYRNHIRSHTGETPFLCQDCGKGFTSKDVLRTHSLTVHSNARPFQCEFCVNKYKSLDYLKRHQQSAHSELIVEVDEEYKLKYTNSKYLPGFVGPKRMYPCEYCSKVFNQTSKRMNHVKAAHKNVNVNERPC